jgi:hypothetical protein
MEIRGWKPLVGSGGSRVGSDSVGCEFALGEVDDDGLMGVPGADEMGENSFRR